MAGYRRNTYELIPPRYTEVVTILYMTTQFHFNSVESFEAFPSAIPLHHSNSIQRISFTLPLWHLMFHKNDFGIRCKAPPHDEETWERVWKLVPSMKNLREVRIVCHMLVHPHSTPSEFDERLLAPIRKIPSNVCVLVVLQWDDEEMVESKGAEMHTDNVTVIRRPMWTRKKTWPSGNGPPDWLIHSPPITPPYGNIFSHAGRPRLRSGRFGGFFGRRR
jgi:hypothetical protein